MKAVAAAKHFKFQQRSNTEFSNVLLVFQNAYLPSIFLLSTPLLIKDFVCH